MLLDKTYIIGYLRDSLRLQDPSIEQDPAYAFSDPQLWDIVTMQVTQHNQNYTIDTFPVNEQHMLIILAKKEIYYRLATSTAPFYPLEAEGANLRKDYRFEHYMSLIRRVEIDYTSAKSNFDDNKEIEVGEVVIDKHHYTMRNYNTSKAPAVDVTIVNTGSDYVDFEWTKYLKAFFYQYVVYLSHGLIFDKFEDMVRDDSIKVAVITDVHKNYLRIKGLTPNTEYHILVTTEDANSLKGYCEVTFTTKA